MPPAVFDQLNLIVRDMDAALAFYRRLGLSIPDAGDWPPDSGAQHTAVTMTDGSRLEFDNLPMAGIWCAGRRDGDVGASGRVIGFSLETREAVDTLVDELRAAGCAVRQDPYDAFWGARYAIVEDPDGNEVGLMSPIDPDRKYTPRV